MDPIVGAELTSNISHSSNICPKNTLRVGLCTLPRLPFTHSCKKIGQVYGYQEVYSTVCRSLVAAMEPSEQSERCTIPVLRLVILSREAIHANNASKCACVICVLHLIRPTLALPPPPPISSHGDPLSIVKLRTDVLYTLNRYWRESVLA